MRKNMIFRKCVTGVSVLALTLGMFYAPQHKATVKAEESIADKTIAGLGTNAIIDPLEETQTGSWDGNHVYFGKYGGNSVKYNVLDTYSTDFNVEGGSLFLDCSSILKNSSWSEDGNMVSWDSSLVYNWMPGLTEDFDYINGFTTWEIEAIAYSNKFNILEEESESAAYEFVPLAGAQFFVLGVAELYNPKYGCTQYVTRQKSYDSSTNANWWLRGPDNDRLVYVNDNGRPALTGNLTNSFGISPAFNVAHSSIISSSLVSGTVGKIGAEFKLTVKDGTTSIIPGNISCDDKKTITVPYSITDNTDKSDNDPTQVSIIVTDGTWSDSGWNVDEYGNDPDLIYYTKLDMDTFSTSGSGTFSMADDVTENWGNKYHIYLLAEDVNGTYETDYASEPVDITDAVKSAIENATPHSIKVSDNIEHGTVTATASAVCGETVTITVTPDDRYQLESLTVKDEDDTELTVTDNTFTMPITAVTIEATFSEQPISAKLAGHSLSLSGNIGVNFYMELADYVLKDNGAYMKFTLPNGDIKNVYVKDVVSGSQSYAYINGETYYIFSCYVAAKEMTDDIKAQIVLSDGSTGEEYTYTIKEYADYIIDNASKNTAYESALPLVKAMLNYGGYAQEYFDYSTTKPANADLTDTEKNVSSVSASDYGTAYNRENVNLPSGVTFVGASLSLKSETVLALYFKSDSELTFAVEGKEAEALSTATVGEYKVLNISGIKAFEIKNDFKVTVTAGENSGTVTYSPKYYCYNVLAGDSYSDELKNTIRSLYKFYDAANSY